MSLLAKAMQQHNESNDYNIWEKISNYATPTGITAIDIMSANLEKDGYGHYSILNGGFSTKPFTMVGNSSSGKSTLAVQAVANMVDFVNKYWPGTSEMIFFDVERYFSIERIKNITGWTDTDVYNKLILYQEDKTNVLDIYNEIRKICDLKEKNKKSLYIKTPLHNLDGVEHYQYSPTFIIIDSIAMLSSVPEFTYDKSGNIKIDEEISKNTEAMTDAKNNTNFIKKVKPLCNKYGLVLIMINHITDEIKISMFDMPTKSLPWLKPGQKITGGRELIYQSAGLLGLMFGEKLDDRNRKYGDDIHGSINKFTFYKNKNGIEGVQFPIVLNADMGYMPELSDFELLTDRKYGLNGVGNYTLQFLPELGSITKRNCYEKCQNDGLIARAIQFTAKIYLVYTLIYKSELPDLERYAQILSFEDRVKIVIKYSETYFRYGQVDKFMFEKYKDALNKHSNVFDSNHLIQSFFGKIAEKTIDYLSKGLIYKPENTITMRDRLNKEQIVKAPNGKRYIKPRKIVN